MRLTTMTVAAAMCVAAVLAACSSDSSDDMGSGAAAGSAGESGGGSAGSAGGSGSAGGPAAGASGSAGGSAAGASGSAGGAAAGASGGDAQTPPMGAAAVESWLKAGDYKKWHCEAAVHEARSPSPHGFNRICSNDLVSSSATGTGDWPQGAAAVKELYKSASDADPVGYAVYLKTKADSAGGSSWYWYERVPTDSAAPHDAAGVVADGMGDAGPAKSICVGCHAAAGSDAAHTPSPGGRDQVYTPVH